MTKLLLLVFLSGSAAFPAAGENAAEAVVVATVEDSRTIVHRKPGSALFYVRIKAKVESVESGRELVRGADHLDLRCWREGVDGHDPIPADGARFRARLTRHPEGHWEPREPDGFELLDGSAARTFPEIRRRQSLTSYLVGGLFGLAVLCAAAVVKYRGRRPRDRSWGEPAEREANQNETVE